MGREWREVTAGWGCGQDSDQHGAAAAVCSPCTSVLGHRLECNPPVWDPLRLVTACLGLSASSGLPHSPAVPVTRGTLTETGGPPCSDPQGTAQEPFWSHRHGLCMPRTWGRGGFSHTGSICSFLSGEENNTLSLGPHLSAAQVLPTTKGVRRL